MEFQQLKESCYAFRGPVNIGYVHHGELGMLIDAGIDKSTMKKILKHLLAKNLPVTHLFISHAHSDHFGGAQYLQEQHRVFTIAPYLEEAIMRYPILEPLYLFGGNDPLPELRNKFLEGNPIQIDKVVKEGLHKIDNFLFDTYLLPGHSYYQLAIRINDILYAGDAYFSEEQLKKHKIPFLTDADQAILSLKRLKEIPCKGAIPGHGVYQEGFHQTVDDNIEYHEELIDWLHDKISSKPEGITHETIVADMCAHYQVNPPQLSQFLLFRTAITSYLLALIKRNMVKNTIERARWVFKAC
ncbi:MBL fold metallo-hydrolase [Aquibacillus halophilus]|uniref:MBL fold metallo-hydrolase n=1 Tax=Aquibacillus halophilus TaxID=930132 RepID=A0A6A8DI45_9BACI|nr:MBL fold metallo-hydrolase [Aquibacillus halophilus]MRH43411.1 MBL fold metallo-hydrolase [Aquibacillus halophilus]